MDKKKYCGIIQDNLSGDIRTVYAECYDMNHAEYLFKHYCDLLETVIDIKEE